MRRAEKLCWLEKSSCRNLRVVVLISSGSVVNSSEWSSQ